MIIFQNPQYLVLLVALPIIVFLHIISVRSTKKRAIKFANFKAISRITGVELFSKNLTSLYVYIGIIILVVLALSGLSFTSTSESSEVPYVIALDVSRSMSAEDLQPNRLQVAKEEANNFVGQAPSGTDIGLITFSSAPIIKSELSDDKEKLNKMISEVELKDVGGTDVLNTVRSAVSLMYEKDGGSLVLISDGSVNINTLNEIIGYSNSNELIIHTIKVGTKEGGEGKFGGDYKSSEETLKALAEETGGEYFGVMNREGLKNSFGHIIETKKKKEILNLSPYLLISCVALLLIFYIIHNSRHRMIP